MRHWGPHDYTAPMHERCRTEVAELHRFFERWLSGETEDFARCEAALADGFTMIGPDGRLIDRPTLMANLSAAHKARRVRIEIRNFDGREIGDGLFLATYEEWQSRDSGSRGRKSTALLAEHPAAPNGVSWLHVHETWLA